MVKMLFVGVAAKCIECSTFIETQTFPFCFELSRITCLLIAFNIPPLRTISVLTHPRPFWLFYERVLNDPSSHIYTTTSNIFHCTPPPPPPNFSITRTLCHLKSLINGTYLEDVLGVLQALGWCGRVGVIGCGGTLCMHQCAFIFVIGHLC